MPSLVSRLLPGSVAWAAWLLVSQPLWAQNPLDLELVAGGQIGAPVIFEVGGQDALAALPKLIMLDVSSLSGGLPIPPLGTLLLPLSPSALTFPGGPGNGYALPINSSPGLVGLTVFAQALGPVSGQPLGTLGLSDLESFTLVQGPAVARLVFSLSALDNGLFAYVFDSLHKRLVPCSFANLSESPSSLCTSPDGRFAFVAQPGSGILRGFRALATCGALELTGASVIDPGTQVLAVDPLLRFLFSASPQTDRLLTTRLNQVTGAPSPTGLSGPPAFTDPQALWVSDKGQHLYALSATLAELRRYSIDATTGALGLQQTVGVPPGSARLLVDPSGSLMAVLAPSSGNLQAFEVNKVSGQLTALTGGAQALGFVASGAALGGAGTAGTVGRLHVGDPVGKSIRSFDVLAGNGALVPTSPAALSLESAPGELLLDEGGGVLLASIPGLAEVSTLPLGPGGLPLAGATVRTRGAVQALAIARGLTPLVPQSRTAIVASEGTAELRVFQYAAADGKLTPVGGGINFTGSGPVGVVISPDNSVAVSSNFGGSSITSFPLNSATIQLGAGQTQVATSPFDLVFEPSGRYAYVSNSGNATIQAFSRQGTQLLPAFSFNLPPNSVPRGIAIDPSGRFVYVALSLSNQLASLQINPISGELALISLVALSGGPFDVCVHPSGRFLYVSLSTLGRVKAYAIDPFDGNLAQLSATSSNAGLLPTVLTVDPEGLRLFCANSNGDSISIYNINQLSGMLTSAAGSPLAVLDDPRGLAVDARGQVLLVVNRALDLVQSFQIPLANVGLTGLSLSATGGDAPRGLALDLVWE